jgi:hypothetical protein
MRGSVARELRKECGYHPKDTRNYQEIEFVVKRQIYQLDGEEVKLVWREVPAFLIECTSGSRKIYKYLKRKWTNLDYEASFNKLPSVADLENIATQVIEDEELTKAMRDSKNKSTGKK